MRPIKKQLLAVMLCVIMASPSYAATWYVATTGSDSNAGTSTSVPFLTIAHAVSAASSGDVIAIRTGTYTLTTPVSTNTLLDWIGFQTTLGDNGTPPLITTATNSVNLFNLGNSHHFENIQFSNTAATPGYGIFASSTISSLTLINTSFTGFAHGIDGQNTTGYGIANLYLENSSVANCTAYGIVENGTAVLKNSFIHNNGIGIYMFSSVPPLILDNTVITANTTGINSSVQGSMIANNSVIAFNTGDGFSNGGSGSYSISGVNTIIYGNGGWGIHLQNLSGLTYFHTQNFAYGSNTSGNYSGFTGIGDITLTANPFVDSSSNNFALNSTSGGGALLKAAGFPGVSLFGTGYIDVNPLQSQAATAGASSYAQ